MLITQTAAQAFLDDLTALCRKHNIWIREPYETAKPILYEGYGDELPYKIEVTETHQITFGRKLRGSK